MTSVFRRLNQGTRVALIGGAFAVFAAICVPLASWLHGLATARSLELVDARFTSPSDLVVRLRNLGTQVAFIKEVRAHVKNIWVLTPEELSAGASSSTAVYELDLPLVEFPYTRTFFVSQELPPNTADEFTLRVNAHVPDDASILALLEAQEIHFPRERLEDAQRYAQYVVAFEVDVVYNETSETIRVGDVLWASSLLGDDIDRAYLYSLSGDAPPGVPEWLVSVWRRNRAQLSEIASVDGVSSPVVARLISLVPGSTGESSASPATPTAPPSAEIALVQRLERLERRLDRLESDSPGSRAKLTQELIANLTSEDSHRVPFVLTATNGIVSDDPIPVGEFLRLADGFACHIRSMYFMSGVPYHIEIRFYRESELMQRNAWIITPGESTWNAWASLNDPWNHPPGTWRCEASVNGSEPRTSTIEFVDGPASG